MAGGPLNATDRPQGLLQVSIRQNWAGAVGSPVVRALITIPPIRLYFDANADVSIQATDDPLPFAVSIQGINRGREPAVALLLPGSAPAQGSACHYPELPVPPELL